MFFRFEFLLVDLFCGECMRRDGLFGLVLVLLIHGSLLESSPSFASHTKLTKYYLALGLAQGLCGGLHWYVLQGERIGSLNA